MPSNKEIDVIDKRVYKSQRDKNRIRQFLDDFHFYKNMKTSFIMFCAYAVSFIGIISIYQKTHKINFVEDIGLQSSYLIFAISFLAEIGLKLHKKKNIIVKMIYGIFFILFFIVILICFASLSGVIIPYCYWRVILIFFIVFLIILLIDSFLVYLIPPFIDVSAGRNNYSCRRKPIV